MLESYSTNAVVAKIRAVCGTMLTMDDFREMVAKRNVAEVADYLAHTARYGSGLRDIDPNTVHRGLLEQLLLNENYEVYKRLCGYKGMTDSPFYTFLLKKAECSQMINLVNAISCGLQDKFVQALPRYVLENSRIDFLALAACHSIGEARAMLRGTKYYKLFGQFVYNEDGSVDFTDAEIKLRTGLYNGLTEDVKASCFGSEEKELLRLIRSEIDVINLINSYRLKAFFDYTPEEIRRSSLPFTQMGRKSMERIYASPDPERMRTVIGSSVYGKYMSADDEDVEPPLRKRTLATMKHTLARTTSAPIALYSFMYICENELRNVVRVIEGVRYDVDPAVIYGLLIF